MDNHLKNEMLQIGIDNSICTGVYQPIRLFIKRQLMTVKKYEEYRPRLISSVSIYDKSADRILWSAPLKKCQLEYQNIPVLIGWSPEIGGMSDLYQRLPDQVISTDASSWDWTCERWIFDDVARLTAGLCIDESYGLWFYKMILKRNDSAYNAVFMLSNGLFFKQMTSGLQKSGMFTTIYNNSVGNYLVHILARMRASANYLEKKFMGMEHFLMFVVGDDVLEEAPPFPVIFLKEVLTTLAKVKEVESQEKKDVEFCQFKFHLVENRRGLPLVFPKPLEENWARYVSNLCISKDPDNTLASMARLYSSQPSKFVLFNELLKKFAPQLVKTRTVLMCEVMGIQ